MQKKNQWMFLLTLVKKEEFLDKKFNSRNYVTFGTTGSYLNVKILNQSNISNF